MHLSPWGAILALALLVAPDAAAQSPPSKATPLGPQPSKAARPARMTNQDVIDLAAAGLSEPLIIAAIRRASNPDFDLTPKGLLALKKASVSEPIIAVMLDPAGSIQPEPAARSVGTRPLPKPPPGGAPPPQPAATTATAVSVVPPGDPEAVHPPGIYVDLGRDAGGLVQLEANRYSGGKTGGVFKSIVTAGIAKAKWKATVSGPRANQRLATPTPIFYFYFEVTNAGLSGAGGGQDAAAATSPNEFVLARFTATRAARELVVGEVGSYGASTGTRAEDTVDVRIEKLAPGAYRVTPVVPLGPGEYCIFHAGAMAAVGGPGGGTMGRLFDFGVDVSGRTP